MLRSSPGLFAPCLATKIESTSRSGQRNRPPCTGGHIQLTGVGLHLDGHVVRGLLARRGKKSYRKFVALADDLFPHCLTLSG